jgi:hypothetical protein
MVIHVHELFVSPWQSEGLGWLEQLSLTVNAGIKDEPACADEGVRD